MNACTYVIFGSTGNLTKEKLMPALYRLEADGRLEKDTVIVASGRRPWDRNRWIEEARGMLEQNLDNKLNEEIWSRFKERLYFCEGDLRNEDMYPHLRSFLQENESFPGNIAFYMAILPSDYGQVIAHLHKNGLLDEQSGWKRVVIEKPFGYDLESAQGLHTQISKYLREDQVFRIDHYLGKSTVQNVLVFRFANVLMEPLWNRNYIDHVQILHSEDIGVGSRAGFYDRTGALRDMIQSHLLQVLTLVAMEPPVSMDSEDLRNEKVKVLKSIRPIAPGAVHAHSFRAQYTSGNVGGKTVQGYLDEENVPSESTTETYAALKLYIDNWRWRGVPFYLRTGKRLAEKRFLVSICFKEPPKQFFSNGHMREMLPNWLLMSIQPDELLRLEMSVKEPGLEMKTQQTSLDACIVGREDEPNDAYAELLLDVMKDDRSLFLRYDEVEYAWQIVDPVLRVWATERDFIPTYQAGTWGPKGSRRIFDTDGLMWRHSLEPIN